jgi:hypothetical protein
VKDDHGSLARTISRAAIDIIIDYRKTVAINKLVKHLETTENEYPKNC